MPKDTWADDQAARIGKTIKTLRGRRSGQWLSDTTAEVGHRVSRTTISEIENGKRKSVSTAEAMVLAAALDIPPILLLYPDYPDGIIEALPGLKSSSEDTALWFTGERSWPGPNGSVIRDKPDGRQVLVTVPANDGVRLVDAVRKRREMPRIGVSMLRTLAEIDTLDEDSKQKLNDELDRIHRDLTLQQQEIERLRGEVFGDVG